MYELFYSRDTASLAPHFVLEEIGAPFSLTLVDRAQDAQKRPAYLARNPFGRVPTLVDGDLVLFESAAICLDLADASIADFYLPMLIRWGANQRNHPKHASGIRRCAELLLQRASVQRAAATERLDPFY